MPVLDDYVVVGAAGVVVATLIILASFLSRFRVLVQEANKSTNLAKELWDSVNSRFALVDGRIIDLMVKTDVLSSRLLGPESAGRTPVRKTPATETSPSPEQMVSTPSMAVPKGMGTETEARVLSFLAGGSKSSAEIKDYLGKSREHTARVMKSLFDRGMVTRNDRNKPYVYELTGLGRTQLSS